MKLVRGLMALAMVAGVACTSADPSPEGEVSTTPTVPTIPSVRPTSPSPDDSSVPVPEEIGNDDGTWTEAVIPNTNASAIVNGYTGGYLVATSSREHDAAARAERIWSIGADGTIDEGFGDDGAVALYTPRVYPAYSIAALEKRTADRSLLALSVERDEDSYGPAFVHRVTAQGTIDGTYLARQGDGFMTPYEVDPFMTVIGGGAVRGCWTERSGRTPNLAMWGLRADGSPDPDVGGDGIDETAIDGRYGCAGIDTDAFGNAVIAAEREDVGASSGNLKRSIELVRLNAVGDRDPNFGPVPLTAPDLDLDAQLMRIARDGSVWVAGIVWPVTPEEDPLRPGGDQFEPAGPPEAFVARADANGRWVSSFGEGGLTRSSLDGSTVGTVTSLDPANQRLLFSVWRSEPSGSGRSIQDVRAISAVRGSPDPSLDGDGELEAPYRVLRVIADGRGGILLFGSARAGATLRRIQLR